MGRHTGIAMLVGLALAGCEATIDPPGFSGGVGGAGGGLTGSVGGGAGGGAVITVSACDVNLYPQITIAQIESDFTANVYPALARAQQGCTACHLPSSGREFKVWVGSG